MDIAADIIGRLCENLNIDSINCVSKCCNGRRSSSPDFGRSIPDAEETKQSGRAGEVVEGGQKGYSLFEKGQSEGIFTDPILVHPAQTASKKVRKKKGNSSK